MAHWDGGCDKVPSSTSQQQHRRLVEHDEREESQVKTKPVNETGNDAYEINSDGGDSWTVLHSEDTSVGKRESDSCAYHIGSNEDYPSGECLLTNNITPLLSSSGFQALSLPLDSASLHTALKEVVNTQEQASYSDASHNAVAPSDLGSSFGSMSGCSTHPDYYCDECALIDASLPSQESIDFWKSIPRRGLDETGCHTKFQKKFFVALKEFSNAEKLLADTKVENLLKTLLKVNLADETAVIEYKNFARLVKYLGPVRPNECVMLQQIRCIKEASIPKDKSRREKLSWFAGEMSRQDAEGLLKKQPSGTYLVRMSQTTVGAFAVSVKYEDSVEHVEVPGDYRKAVTSHPYDARLSLNGSMYTSLVEAVKSLKTNPLSIIENAEEAEEGEGGTDEGGTREEHEEEHEGERNEIRADVEMRLDIFCRFCCPDLPLNGVISGYKKTHRR